MRSPSRAHVLLNSQKDVNAMQHQQAWIVEAMHGDVQQCSHATACLMIWLRFHYLRYLFQMFDISFIIYLGIMLIMKFPKRPRMLK